MYYFEPATVKIWKINQHRASKSYDFFRLPVWVCKFAQKKWANQKHREEWRAPTWNSWQNLCDSVSCWNKISRSCFFTNPCLAHHSNYFDLPIKYISNIKSHKLGCRDKWRRNEESNSSHWWTYSIPGQSMRIDQSNILPTLSLVRIAEDGWSMACKYTHGRNIISSKWKGQRVSTIVSIQKVCYKCAKTKNYIETIII